MKLLTGILLLTSLNPVYAQGRHQPFAMLPAGHWVYRALRDAGCQLGPAPKLTRYEAALLVASRIKAVTPVSETKTPRAQLEALHKAAVEVRTELAQLGVGMQSIASLLPRSSPPKPRPASEPASLPPPLPRLSRADDSVRSLDGFLVGLDSDAAGAPRLRLELAPRRDSIASFSSPVGGLPSGWAGRPTRGFRGYQPAGLGLTGRFGSAQLSARMRLPDPSGSFTTDGSSAASEYSLNAAVPLGIGRGTLGASYARVANLFGAARDNVLTTHLDMQLTRALSVSASLARAGVNPFKGERSWNAQASYSPGSLTLGAKVMTVDPDFVRLGYLGPTVFDTHESLRGVGGSVTYQSGDSLSISGGVEGYGLESDTPLSIRRYLAGVGYTLNERLALDFTLARLETAGQRELTSTYATFGLGISLTSNASLRLLYRLLDTQDNADSSEGGTVSSVVATQFSVRF